ncbi:hypothetical protein SAMN05444372_110157 [Flavobacterium micromati]|uniref:MetA-pathway of phenol degradation n=1 Tax=Flavobacterium micromati TaxID=229205 RepID=A0A1M5N533_9FLAO|nr:hypothetical protein [Flavobacterium micromati]SHG84696.1 hypothetical protein SAMN05444372_110157 [Flavobacterium micromati]
MKSLKILLILFLVSVQSGIAQENQEQEQSNIQTYTPSKLLEKGKWDIKWFNNLYTQNKEESNGNTRDIPRSNFFTTSLEVFTGASTNKKFNAGVILEIRSNTFGGQNASSVFSFDNEIGKARTSLSHIAPSVKIAPFSSLPRFSIQSSFFIPVFDKENNENGFLAQKSFIWQNRFFYDYTFPGAKFQLFSEFGTRLFLGKKEEGFANNSIELAPGIFLSYFPTSKFTVLGFVQHAQLVDLGNDFSQNYSAIGTGAKYQLTKVLNLEVLYSKFVRGNDSGLGQSFNLGLRAIF